MKQLMLTLLGLGLLVASAIAQLTVKDNSDTQLMFLPPRMPG
jgi:hypothetical protein